MSGSGLLLFAAGAALLIAGAEVLVRGASRLARAAGVSSLVIGLTVVAFGTSSPELAVTWQAAAAGRADIALGNVVGSNILNVLLILGASAAIAPLVVSRQVVRWDLPLMIFASLLLPLLSLDGKISRLDGLLLAAGMAAYLTFALRLGRRITRSAGLTSAPVDKGRPLACLVDGALVLAGLTMLVQGSRWLVRAAAELARAFGLSELVIGLTVVAVGTSLPEVATSLLAAMRGERDIAVGNVVGSNLFNILAVLGLSAVFSPHGIAVPGHALAFDIPVMIAAAVACLPVFFTGHRIARWEGFLFLGYYAAYTLYLILKASHHEALPVFQTAMLGFVLPLTAATLLVLAVRAARAR